MEVAGTAIVEWARCKDGVHRFMVCGNCQQFPRGENQYVCSDGHVVCDNCGETAESCPYAQITDGIKCRRIIAKVKITMAQQHLTDYFVGIKGNTEASEKYLETTPDSLSSEEEVVSTTGETTTPKAIEESVVQTILETTPPTQGEIVVEVAPPQPLITEEKAGVVIPVEAPKPSNLQEVLKPITPAILETAKDSVNHVNFIFTLSSEEEVVSTTASTPEAIEESVVQTILETTPPTQGEIVVDVAPPQPLITEEKAVVVIPVEAPKPSNLQEVLKPITPEILETAKDYVNLNCPHGTIDEQREVFRDYVRELRRK